MSVYLEYENGEVKKVWHGPKPGRVKVDETHPHVVAKAAQDHVREIALRSERANAIKWLSQNWETLTLAEQKLAQAMGMTAPESVQITPKI